MATKTKLNPRKMMEKAIEVMRSSVAENRNDGKPNPLVGAVLVRSDGSIETAARGELREGNHAEFTLLERKCVGEKLDGSVLFATLEPCLNRNHPKRGCARHIVSARIKEVWVGIQDDNPTVAGKGIEHLRQHGVTVHMFDRDLQEVILAENKTFFEWARKQTEKPEPEPIKLSKYEDPITAVVLGDLSEKALERYRSKAGIKSVVGSAEFARLLRQQGLLTGEGDAATPTGFGFLLFGKEPRNAVPQAGVLARADLADGKVSRAEFGQAMVLIPGQLEEWLDKTLPSTLDRSRMERREQVDLPFEMVREAVVNALIHRDYDIAWQKCQLVVNADTITIKSPGGPIAPITLEQMRSIHCPDEESKSGSTLCLCPDGHGRGTGIRPDQSEAAGGEARASAPELFDGRRFPRADDLSKQGGGDHGSRQGCQRKYEQKRAGWLGVARDQRDDIFDRVCRRHGSSQPDGAQSSQAIHRFKAFGKDRLWTDNSVSRYSPMKLQICSPAITPNFPPKWRDRCRLEGLFHESRQISRHFGVIGGLNQRQSGKRDTNRDIMS